MIKLYKKDGTDILYWETWDNEDGTHTIHWGKLGEEGESVQVKKSLSKSAEAKVKEQANDKRSFGFQEIVNEEHDILLIEYTVDGFGSDADLAKRHKLQERMDETLGWTGLGHCDGGSIGSGTMEVCCCVIDFTIAKRLIEKDLENTEFADYTKIFKDNG